MQIGEVHPTKRPNVFQLITIKIEVDEFGELDVYECIDRLNLVFLKRQPEKFGEVTPNQRLDIFNFIFIYINPKITEIEILEVWEKTLLQWLDVFDLVVSQ